MILTATGVLAGLSEQELQYLYTLGTILSYNRDEIVFVENSYGREWYIVLEGLVYISTDPATLGTLDPGSTDLRAIIQIGAGGGFGEVALIDEQSRSATATCASDGTRLFVITPANFDRLLATSQATAATIYQNIVRDLSTKLRHTKRLFTQQLLISHHVRALREELDADSPTVDPLTPLHKTLILRDHDAFILADFAKPKVAATREIIDVLVFAEPRTLHALIGPGEPSGEVILHAMFSLIKHGQLPPSPTSNQFSYRNTPLHGRRAGVLMVTRAGWARPYTIEWQMKGVQYNHETATMRASLCVWVSADPASSPSVHANELIAGTTMPIQRTITKQLQDAGTNGADCRILVVHHRTHEVAHTLHMLRQLGYAIDSFAGIPYGEASWATNVMLDQASGHCYVCLRAIPYPDAATKYVFDFMHSSFLHANMERDISALYANPINTSSYLAAMTALLEYLLERALRTCRSQGKKLLIYEDGAYVTPIIYQLYNNPAHRLHQLIRTAVDTGMLAGSVEVTTSGERKHVALIKEHHGRALVPVLSGARDDIKLLYEAIGVAEAVIQSACTALGNLGLPTFASRHIAVAGGNGAIGTRLVEQLIRAHNGASNIFVVDPNVNPFMRAMPAVHVPALATKLRYHGIPRYQVPEHSLPMALPRDGSIGDDEPLLFDAIRSFLQDHALYQELVLVESFPLDLPNMDAFWCALAAETGYQYHDHKLFDNGSGFVYFLARDGVERRITMLAQGVVLAFTQLRRLILAGIDTVIGMSGTPSFTREDLDAFLERPVAPGQTDDLVLISGSSKDYEFQEAIDRLNQLLAAEPSASMSGFNIRKTIHRDIGSVYHFTHGLLKKRLVLIADGFVVNFYARYEKGVKTEYMDPIMSMQLLGLAQLSSTTAIPPGLHATKTQIRLEYVQSLWQALDEQSQPPRFF